jgi:galactoside O-acetyltransferase
VNGLQLRVLRLYQRCRIAKFRFLSDCKRVEGRPSIFQPVLLLGKGQIKFLGKVNLGFFPAPYHLSGYTHIEARAEGSVIEIQDSVWMNNNVTIVSAGPGITIGARTMIGTHCEIIDSDFHDLHPDRRNNPGKSAKVDIGENVLIGSNVKILKGVRIGKNAVIANSAVVMRSVPENGTAFGNPAKVGFGLAHD